MWPAQAAAAVARGDIYGSPGCTTHAQCTAHVGWLLGWYILFYFARMNRHCCLLAWTSGLSKLSQKDEERRKYDMRVCTYCASTSTGTAVVIIRKHTDKATLKKVCGSTHPTDRTFFSPTVTFFRRAGLSCD